MNPLVLNLIWMRFGNMVDIASCCFRGCSGCNIFYGLFSTPVENPVDNDMHIVNTSLANKIFKDEVCDNCSINSSQLGLNED